MQLTCYNNKVDIHGKSESAVLGLTVGKTYDVLQILNIHGVNKYYVIDDTGRKQGFTIARFIKPAEAKVLFQIICIDALYGLTAGKVYDVIDVSIPNRFGIVNDNNHKKHYATKRFTKV